MVKEMQSLGTLLRSRRKELKLLQKDVAIQVGITNQYLCDLEQDKRTPSNLIISKLTRVLQVNPDYPYILLGKFPPDLIGQIPLVAVSIRFEKWRQKYL